MIQWPLVKSHPITGFQRFIDLFNIVTCELVATGANVISSEESPYNFDAFRK